jgi:hypothetical protein
MMPALGPPGRSLSRPKRFRPAFAPAVPTFGEIVERRRPLPIFEPSSN